MMHKLAYIYGFAFIVLFAIFCAAGIAHAQLKTQPLPTPNRANATASSQGGGTILIPPASNQGDNCSVVQTGAYGNTSFGIALNLQKVDGNCVRLRDVRAWLDIAVVSGNKFYADVAAQRMLQDANNDKAYLSALKWHK